MPVTSNSRRWAGIKIADPDKDVGRPLKLKIVGIHGDITPGEYERQKNLRNSTGAQRMLGWRVEARGLIKNEPTLEKCYARDTDSDHSVVTALNPVSEEEVVTHTFFKLRTLSSGRIPSVAWKK